MSLLLKFTHTHTWFPSNNTPTCCNGWANIIYNRLKCHLFYVFNHFNLCIFIIQVCQKEVISNNLSHVCITFDNMSLVILELLIAFIIVAKFLHSEPILMSVWKYNGEIAVLQVCYSWSLLYEITRILTLRRPL